MTIPAIKSNVLLISEPVYKVTYVDGIVIEVKGANNSRTRKPLYLKALADQVVTPPIIIIPPVGAREIGNKELSVLRDVENESFVLKPGVYTQECDLSNLKNVSIDGLGKVEFQTKGRAIEFKDTAPIGVKLNGMSFKNIQDYCVSLNSSGTTKGFSFTNMKAENCGTVLHIDGDINRGRIEDLIIDRLTFINSPEPRSIVYVGNAKNYSVSNCIVDNINYQKPKEASNGTHNGIFQLNGWGKFFNNKITNHQGNALRAWLFSQDETGLVEIYNNIVWNSWKYGAFELQNTYGGKPANAKVYNNTAGKMNTIKDWEGQLLDLYNTGGTLEYYNNLGFDMIASNPEWHPVVNMINNMSDVPIKQSNNKYFKNWQDAVTDLTTFKSKFNGIGANL